MSRCRWKHGVLIFSMLLTGVWSGAARAATSAAGTAGPSRGPAPAQDAGRGAVDPADDPEVADDPDDPGADDSGASLVDQPAAASGKYEFLLPLGVACLNGAYAATVNTSSGLLTLALDAKGGIQGHLSVGDSEFAVSGKLKVTATGAKITLLATGPTGPLRLNATFSGASLMGTSNGGRRQPALTGPFVVDISDAAPIAADATLDLSIDARGKVTGTGTVVICGASTTVTAKGRSANGKATLSLKSTALTFAAHGPSSVEGFTVDWTGRLAGAAAKGRGLLIAPVDQADGFPKTDVVSPLPALSVDPPVPAAGSTATVTIDLPGASQITVTAQGTGCGAFGVLQQAGSHLSAARAVGEFGECVLAADVVTPQGTKHHGTAFTVEPTDLLLPALEVLDGVFHPGDLPPATGSADDPDVDTIDGPGSLINGGTAELHVHLSDPSRADEISTAYVQVEGAQGFAGYYEVPATLDGDAIVVRLRLDESLFAPTSARDRQRFASQAQTNEEIAVKLRNRAGTIGTEAHRSFPVHEVGAGEIKVSVSWNTPTDVDLHVVEPTGFEIYYGATQSPSGGRLDLDSNPGCGIDGVNNENIVWGADAPAGEYIVRVDFYDACEPPPHGAGYTVTTNVCGEVKTYEGSFSPGSDDHGGRGSGREIARFTVSCDKKRVRGKAVYEDFAQTDSGLATTSTMLPIRFARVEVHRASDGLVLQKGDTKQDGTFDLTFKNNGEPGYYVEVKADQQNGIVSQYVVDKNEQIYKVRSEGTFDEEQTPDRTDVLIEAPANGAGPAFNIFDVGVEAAATMRLVTGSRPPRLKWWWQRDDKGLCDVVASCYSKVKSRISVCSDPSDRDEYDDLVLLHEYGHFFNTVFMHESTPGGIHSGMIRVKPTLAWAEGSATFFGNYVRRTPVFLDTTASGVGVRRNLEDVDPLIPTGTDDSNQTGKISETIVAAILWDIADATTVPSDKDKDRLTDPNGIFGGMSVLGSSLYVDRINPGQDLVDFLDGWFCVGNGHQGELEDIVFGIHTFDYDFLGPNGTCRGTP